MSIQFTISSGTFEVLSRYLIRFNPFVYSSTNTDLGHVQVEKTGSWSSVAKHLGLTLNTPEPTLSTCHSLSNAFKTSGLAQFEAWYSISICAGKFVPVNGKEIPYLLPDPSAHDVFAELVHIWCDYSAVMTPTEPDPGVALAEYLRKTLTSCSQSPLNKPDPMVDKFKALSSGLSGMRLHLRQVQAILEMGSSTPEALSLQGIPDSTIAFVQEHGEAIREIQARHVASLSGGNAAPTDPSEEAVQTGASS